MKPYILRNLLNGYNGYVVISKDHPVARVSYSFIDNIIEVHGGITFFETGERFKELLHKRFLESDGISDDDLVLGFDTCHALDTPEYWTYERVKAETKKLYKQLENKKLLELMIERSKFEKLLFNSDLDGTKTDDGVYVDFNIKALWLLYLKCCGKD